MCHPEPVPLRCAQGWAALAQGKTPRRISVGGQRMLRFAQHDIPGAFGSS